MIQKRSLKLEAIHVSSFVYLKLSFLFVKEHYFAGNLSHYSHLSVRKVREISVHDSVSARTTSKCSAGGLCAAG